MVLLDYAELALCPFKTDDIKLSTVAGLGDERSLHIRTHSVFIIDIF